MLHSTSLTLEADKFLYSTLNLSKAAIWLLAPDLLRLKIDNASEGITSMDIFLRRERGLQVAISLIRYASKLESLDFFGQLGLTQSAVEWTSEERRGPPIDFSQGTFESTALEQTLPFLASIPKIERDSAEWKPLLHSLSYLFPALQEIHSGKLHQPLQKKTFLRLEEKPRKKATSLTT